MYIYISYVYTHIFEWTQKPYPDYYGPYTKDLDFDLLSSIPLFLKAG